MKNKSSSEIIKATAVFVGLVVLGVSLTVLSKFIGENVEQNILINIGSAIIGGSLAFFLIEMFRLDRESQSNN
jgi:hypothetical protein